MTAAGCIFASIISIRFFEGSKMGKKWRFWRFFGPNSNSYGSYELKLGSEWSDDLPGPCESDGLGLWAIFHAKITPGMSENQDFGPQNSIFGFLRPLEAPRGKECMDISTTTLLGEPI